MPPERYWCRPAVSQPGFRSGSRTGQRKLKCSPTNSKRLRAFARYVVQDACYLHDFARALTVVGSKAPTHASVAMFARHAACTVEVELALHESLMPELGIRDIDAVPVAPTTRAYTSYLLAIAYGAPP